MGKFGRRIQRRMKKENARRRRGTTGTYDEMRTLFYALHPKPKLESQAATPWGSC